MKIHEVISTNEGPVNNLAKLVTRTVRGVPKTVSRVDPAAIKDFNSGLKTYHHTPNWHGSGQFAAGEKIPAELTSITKGMFAGTNKLAATYAAPRNVKSLAYVDPKTGRHTLVFDPADRTAIQAYRPVHSTFSGDTFKRTVDKKSLGGSEYISTQPGAPISQKTIEDPIAYMQAAGWDVKFDANIASLRDSLKKSNIPHNAENM
jgi:hypothetical protein